MDADNMQMSNHTLQQVKKKKDKAAFYTRRACRSLLTCSLCNILYIVDIPEPGLTVTCIQNSHHTLH